ncbi:hypothetical protein [Reichenbachiella ulvae]|uniref:PEP-CTERM protein-sorting domain-containing protein n=1 Tax=Reichenbachiella ulvae TaxID=2980104 RepID=A0ABT3CTN5_9BACT|nr:hypothetical protein [Reichenbachiella ulvae]MCV9386889.1 hypothetical protein [Reichenbachiella ulvae]
MNPRLLQRIGVVGGFLLIFLATSEFLRSYRLGEPKWMYLVMIFGMAIVLTSTLFRKRRK